MAFRLFESASHARAYAQFRPTYPSAIAEKIVEALSKRPGRASSWTGVDVACGSGQSTSLLASSSKFEKMYALDISEEQVKQAHEAFGGSKGKENVEFRVASAENLSLPSASADLVACGQALHWFDLEKFYAEVDRVLVPGGFFAAFGYCNCQMKNQQVEEIVRQFYDGVLDGYWSPQRRHVEQLYHTLPMPYGNVERLDISVPYDMTIPDFVGYVSSWSAYQGYCEKHPGNRILEDFKQSITKAANSTSLQLSFPFFLLLSSKPSA